jgi:hypothetical protein
MYGIYGFGGLPLSLRLSCRYLRNGDGLVEGMYVYLYLLATVYISISVYHYW